MVQNLCLLDLIKKMDFFINYGGIRYLTLFGSEKYGAVYDRIRYLKVSKSLKV